MYFTLKKLLVKGEKSKKATCVLFISPTALALGLVSSMSMAFAMGRYLCSRGIIVSFDRNEEPFDTRTFKGGMESDSIALPEPHNKNYSVCFDSGGFFKAHITSPLLKDDLTTIVNPPSTQFTNTVEEDVLQHKEVEAEAIHEPVGQHLLVDIENVQSAFLKSEHRLSTAMMDVIERSELNLLSFHCHGLVTTGFSCVGALLQGHVSFRTWPKEGVITLDLFGGTPNSLIPLVDLLFNLFGVPREDSGNGDQPQMRWSYKKRGFRNGSARTDLERFLGDVELYKEEIASVATDIQEMRIYDIIEPRFRDLHAYRSSKDSNGSTNQSLHPELFQKDRLLFLDGVLQSRRYGDAAYHEALVHPSMITHKAPKHVVIVGGGEGAVLRELLKHNTVKKVVMLQADAKVMHLSKEYLPKWSDCGDLVGGSKSCFDDPRVEIYQVDPVDWFLQRFDKDRDDNDDATILEPDRYDVVLIADASDPSTSKVFDNEGFVEALHNALWEDGIVAVQIGEASSDVHLHDAQVDRFIQNLVQSGFESIQEYEQMVERFEKPQRYLVVMKDRASRGRWKASEAEISLYLQKRMERTIGGELPLRHFDGATMMSYQLPSRVAEQRFCRKFPEECNDGDGFDPEKRNHPLSSFEIKASTVGGGRGIFTLHDIAKGDYLAVEESAQHMFIPPFTHELIFHTLGSITVPSDFLHTLGDGYIEGYGLHDSFFGLPCTEVDPGIFTFTNHGCNGTYNMGIVTNDTEATVAFGTQVTSVYDGRSDPFNPHEERQYFTLDESTSLLALRDISAGEEMLENYLLFGGGENQEDFESMLHELKRICGGGKGIVAEYEEVEGGH